jgi:hypothetical protein
MDSFTQADGGRGFTKRSRGSSVQSFIRPKPQILQALSDTLASRPSDSNALEEIEIGTCSDTSPHLQSGVSDISSWDGVLDVRLPITSDSEERGTAKPVDDGIDDTSASGAIQQHDDTIITDADDFSSHQGKLIGGAMAEESSTAQSSMAIASKFDEDVRVLVASTPP